MSIRQRLNSITQIPELYRGTVLPVPKSVKIELSPRCNYLCKYCGYTYRRDKRHDMDLELFKRITKEMKDIGVEEIGVFYIGESFMNPKLLISAIEYLKKDLNIPYVFLTSNASLAKPDYAEACMKAGLDSLKWSCNFCGESQFEMMAGVPMMWLKAAKDNIRINWEIREIGRYPTKLYASSIKYDEQQVEDMKPFLERFVLPYVDEHYWLPLYTMGGLAKDGEKEIGLRPVAGNPGRCDNLVDPIPCWTVFTAGHVLSDGRLTACCMDAIGKWVMGDLKTQSFMEAWNCDRFQKLRQAHLDNDIIGTVCQKCALTGENT